MHLAIGYCYELFGDRAQCEAEHDAAAILAREHHLHQVAALTAYNHAAALDTFGDPKASLRYLVETAVIVEQHDIGQFRAPLATLRPARTRALRRS